ncbi:MAG: type 2 lanthipeptide synthetase LanM family protein [Xanthobacteraceae bacterium]
MDALYDRLRLRAATIDELLSDAFTALPGATADADLTGRRVAAWCRASAAGDEALFARRLARDGLTIDRLRQRLAATRPNPAAPPPAWIGDAAWVQAALQDRAPTPITQPRVEPVAFEELFLPLVARAEQRLWSGLDEAASHNLTPAARACLSLGLLRDLSALSAPALYERFAKARSAGASSYAQFVAGMQSDGFCRLFEDKPVLLRLLATLARQWLDTSREFVNRLAADLPAIRRDLLPAGADNRVVAIERDLSDPHNGGRSVHIVRFGDGARIVYKPKDLRLDVAWHRLIERLNRADPPVALKAVRTIARDGYGWSEFIDHAACADERGFPLFFRRAGAWLALFHVFAATDLHQENMIACGDHPVPIDLETILQPSADEHKIADAEGEAFNAAMDIIANSVMTVGLLPAYGRSVDNNVFVMGGMTADWGARTVIKWNAINSDGMRPSKAQEPGETNTNLPHHGGRHAKFADHVESFVSGFADYASFLRRLSRNTGPTLLFDGFAGVPVRKVVRPTRFYYMLLQRLKDHRTMDDGAGWSAQADFIARLSEWDKDSDPLWPLLRAERAALLALNVPHFVAPSDGDEIADAYGASAQTQAVSGLARARERLQKFDDREIAWQIDVIRENTNSILPADARSQAAASEKLAFEPIDAAPAKASFIAEADRIAAELARNAIRRGPAAAWIGLDWLGDSEVFQLVCLGPDLYNGSTGIAFFLAAHAAATRHQPSRELALAALAQLRKNLTSRNVPRLARALGIGAATGLGSIVYALAVTAKCLDDGDLLADAEMAATLVTDELIAADKQLDVMGGSAGAILGLLRLHRDTGSRMVLNRAIRCAEHLLAQPRIGAEDRRSWMGQEFRAQAHATSGSGADPVTRGLNGMSHGAAGFAYALSSLAAATGREDFAKAASECIAYEDSTYDDTHHNWPDWRGPNAPTWPCQWCHGAPGVGLARLGMQRFGGKAAKLSAEPLATDIRNAAIGVERASSGAVDTLCCGALGRIEFICEAAGALDRADLRELAARRLSAVLQQAAKAGDYRWNSGKRQFNLGLFRGLSGVGYTLLRQATTLDSGASLPNVLIWE